MNPFRRTQPEPITEQDLFALHLNELSAARAREVRRAVAQDRALAAESAAIAATFAAVTLNEGNSAALPLGSVLLDRNWQAIRPALALHAPVSTPWQTSTFAACALAAMAACIALIAQHHHPAGPGHVQVLDPKAATAAAMAPAAPSHDPVLTSVPRGKTDLRARDSGIQANFTSGIYRPNSGSAEAPVHLIGLAAQPDPAAIAGAADVHRQPPLTAQPVPPVPPLTPQPQPSSSASSLPAQTLLPGKLAARSSGKARHAHPIDIMLGMGGTLVPANASGTANTESRTIAVSHAVVALGSLHQQFRRGLGYRATLSYTRPDFAYTNSSTTPGTGFYQEGRINSRIFEAAGTYVVEGPRHKRLSTSVDVGGALMAFLPNTGADPAARVSYRPVGVVGANVDYAITKHVGARVGYRAQIFKGPSFRYSGTATPVTTPYLVDNEPSLGVTYTFSRK